MSNSFSVQRLLQALGTAAVLGGWMPMAWAAEPAATTCVPKDQKVNVTSVGSGWVVTRDACAGEKEAQLAYSHGDKASGTVAGKLTDKTWSFAIPEKIEENELLRLEFRIASTPASPVKTEPQRAFASQLRDGVNAAFDDAVKIALQASPATQEAVLKAQFSLAARKRVGDLLKRAQLDAYVTKTDAGLQPWTEAVLSKAGFHKLGAGDWEPGDAVLDKLKAWSSPDSQLFSDARARSTTPPSAVCLAGPAPDSKAPPAVQNAVLKSCVTALASSAKALAGAKDANALTFSTLSEEDPAALAKLLVRVDATEAAGRGSVFLRKIYSDALQKLELVQARPAQKAEQAQFNESERAVLYLAAQQVAAALQPKVDAVNDALIPAEDTLLELSVFVRENLLGEVFKIEPAKPRFFVSTGVVVTSLNSGIGDPYKLAVPVLVSICLSPNGCETKGIGAKGSPGMYVSADLGVKTFWIGTRNPRENAPSFLFGLGFTPIYATHIGIGVNAFDNPQTSRANFAPYLSVTVDVVDGKDILGSLGIAPPKAEPIGKTEQ
jgi:hypothetical protein